MRVWIVDAYVDLTLAEAKELFLGPAAPDLDRDDAGERRGGGGGLRAAYVRLLLSAALLGAVLWLSGCSTLGEVRSAKSEVRNIAGQVAEAPGGLGVDTGAATAALEWMAMVGGIVAVAGVILLFWHPRSGTLVAAGGVGCLVLAMILPALAPYALGSSLIGGGMLMGYYVGRNNLVRGVDPVEPILCDRANRDRHGMLS